MKGLYIKTAKFGKGAAGGSITHTFGMINGFVAAGVELTVLTAEEIDPCEGNVVILPVKYNKSLPPFIRDYVYYKQYWNAIKIWIQQNPQRYDFFYSRHMALSTLAKKYSTHTHTYMVTEVNNTQCDSTWSLVIEPKMRMRRPVLRPIYYLAGKGIVKLIKCMENPVFRASDHIIVISQPIKEKMISRGLASAENILVLPNGVDTERFHPDPAKGNDVRQELSVAPENIVVGFAGTFGNWHGIPELTEAIDSIADRQDITFLLMGDGLMKPQMQKQLGKYQNVIFTGLIPYSEMPAYLAACDILIVSNSWDPKFKEPFFGSPTKLFEYMSMGKAVVASRLEQMNELLTDGKSALMFNPGDVPGMASAILRAAGDPALRDRLGRNAREIAVQKHTWQANAQAIVSVVESSAAVTHKK